MNRDKAVGIFKGFMWFLTTLWFGYLSAVVLWNIDKGSWRILLDFNAYGEAVIEIPIFFITMVWLLIFGTKRTCTFLTEHSNILENTVGKLVDAIR